MLWRANWDAVESWVDREDRVMAEPPDYVFEPLTGRPDPLLVLKQIAFYRYQTSGDEDQQWLLSEPAAFLDALTQSAIVRLPGEDDRPWIVEDGVRDLFVRFGGPDPDGAPVPPDADDPVGRRSTPCSAAPGCRGRRRTRTSAGPR